ncbi:hypothetical protein ACVWWR_002991 [Bradyrhizobium sp. LM3.2]
MTMDPAHGTIGGEEPDQRDVQKNNFADMDGNSQPASGAAPRQQRSARQQAEGQPAAP